MKPPPGPFRPDFWRSPIRGPWMTAILGSILLVGVTIVSVTGFLSHAAYEPDFPANAIVDAGADLPLTFNWPTSPSWIYALTQGLHVTVGLATIPFLLAKLWSVIPRLFTWPPVTTPATMIERGVIGLLVASSIFQFVTGTMNAQYWYAFGFDFVRAHYWGAVVFVAALFAHLVIKLPVARRAYRDRGVLKPLRDDIAGTRPEPPDEHGLVAREPADPTISRRGLLGFVGAGSLLIALGNAGQSLGGPFKELAIFAPRQEDFPVNKPFEIVSIPMEAVGDSWRLKLRGGGEEVELSRADLLAMDLRTEKLPIACVEGWASWQTWTGVRLRDLAALAGVDRATVTVESLQPGGRFRLTTHSADAVADERSLLALQVNGEDLSLDHGFPARIIVPGVPGVHQTKWVEILDFEAVEA